MSTHTSAALYTGPLLLAGAGFPGVVPKSSVNATVIRDENHGGTGRIIGTVKEAGSPFDVAVQRRVRLHRKVDGMMIRETWSAADGTYAFNNIVRTQQYYVLSFDHTGDYNGVIKDSITPEAMP